MARLLLIGGGHSHLFVLESLAQRREAGVDTTLVSPSALTTYTGMVPGVLGGQYPLRAAQIDVDRLAQRAGAAFVAGRVAAIDPAARRVTLANGVGLDYDLVSFDIGARSAAIAPVADGAPLVPIKPIEAAIPAIDTVLAAQPAPHAVVVGAGAGGCEVALALAARGAAVTICDRSPQPLDGFAPRAARLTARAFAAAGIAWRGAVEIAAFETGGVRLDDGELLPATLMVAAAGVESQELFADAGLPVDGRGFLIVNDTLRCAAQPAIFAAGDTASLAGHPRLARSGVHAVRQGPLLAANLRAALRGEPLQPFRPQRRTLALLNTADGRAILAYGPVALQARWAWWLKDRIDRGFVERFDRARRRSASPAGTGPAATASQ